MYRQPRPPILSTRSALLYMQGYWKAKQYKCGQDKVC